MPMQYDIMRIGAVFYITCRSKTKEKPINTRWRSLYAVHQDCYTGSQVCNVLWITIFLTCSVATFHMTVSEICRLI